MSLLQKLGTQAHAETIGRASQSSEPDHSLASLLSNKIMSGMNASSVDAESIADLSKSMSEALKEEFLGFSSSKDAQNHITVHKPMGLYHFMWWLAVFLGVLGLVCTVAPLLIEVST